MDVTDGKHPTPPVITSQAISDGDSLRQVRNVPATGKSVEAGRLGQTALVAALLRPRGSHLDNRAPSPFLRARKGNPLASGRIENYPIQPAVLLAILTTIANTLI